ncbi:hypothetical protein ASE75_05440 [Sphingomonas sp. Leaf17]|uniref:hypothetical protein n=1 Tax=Sphingomonas sp. Leaf17 TaxID=1735683 RepID=UPI0006FD4EF3|nr:hypothetical protein [Sphingomonas sp. Leaf17]KQM65684.1 hypothetical protein ASE75_05440 [Sphingomonas sp. Leaf17]
MAYRNFSDTAFTETVAATAPATLTPLERTTVLLSIHDSRCSLGASPRFDRIVGALFGIARPSRLADVRLEALRRYAILLRMDGDSIDPVETATLRDLGFSAGQMVAVRALIAQAA